MDLNSIDSKIEYLHEIIFEALNSEMNEFDVRNLDLGLCAYFEYFPVSGTGRVGSWLLHSEWLRDFDADIKLSDDISYFYKLITSGGVGDDIYDNSLIIFNILKKGDELISESDAMIWVAAIDFLTTKLSSIIQFNRIVNLYD